MKHMPLLLTGLLLTFEFALSQECNVCEQSPQLQSPPKVAGQHVDFEFTVCCPFLTNTTECEAPDDGIADRVTGLNESIVQSVRRGLETEDITDLSLTFYNMGFERTDRYCCHECTCYGDPNCINFNGIKETWILCDSRTVPSDPVKRSRGYCPLTKRQCNDEVDAYGEPCVWLPDQSATPRSEWQIEYLGSPCQPKNESIITMYIADTFRLDIGQGERGNIKSARLTLGNKYYMLTAERCMNRGRKAWTGDSITRYFERSVRKHPSSALTEGEAVSIPNDVIWEIFDPSTGIFVTIRCETVVEGGWSRIDIESLVEPEVNYQTERNPLGGFCPTGNLGNRYPSRNTRYIEENGLCWRNGPATDVVIARIVCEDPSLTLHMIDECYKGFCTRFSSPSYTLEECYNTISNPEDNLHWEHGFCNAFTELPTDFNQCVDDLRESTSETAWMNAIARYYNPEQVSPVQCVHKTFEDYRVNGDVPNCFAGVELQYYRGNRWETVIAIPENEPPCPDVEFKVLASSYPYLFNYPIRWEQKRAITKEGVEKCGLDECAPVNGFLASMSINFTVSAFCDILTETRFFNIGGSELLYNNLGGLGPNVNENGRELSNSLPVIWYQRMLIQDRKYVDMVMRVKEGSEYHPSNLDADASTGISRNGKFGALGQINLKCSSSVVLEYIFLYHECAMEKGPGWNPAYDLSCDIQPGFEDFQWRTYDIDRYIFNVTSDQLENVESVLVCDGLYVVPVEDQAVQYYDIDSSPYCNNGGIRLVATTFGTERDNPRVILPTRRTQRQKMGLVIMKPYLNRVTVRYALEGPDRLFYDPRCGRRILFSGAACIRDEDFVVPNKS